MSSLLKGKVTLYSKLLVSLLLASCSLSVAEDSYAPEELLLTGPLNSNSEEAQKANRESKPLYRESKMVPVNWYSTPNAGSIDADSIDADSTDTDSISAMKRSVAKPLVDEWFKNKLLQEGTLDKGPVEHTVYQAPSVYLDSPRNNAASNPLVEGFREAGQNLGQATSETLGEFGTGIKNTASNTFNTNDDLFYAESNQPNNTNVTLPNVPSPSSVQQTAANDPSGIGQRFNDPQFNNTNNSNSFNNNYANNNPPSNYDNSSNSPQLNEIPAVPRRQLDPSISKSFGNRQSETNPNYNDSNQNYPNFNSRMAPVQNQQQSNSGNTANFGSATNGYPYQNQQNPPTNPPYPYQQQNPPLLAAPTSNYYAGNNNPQSSNWPTPSFNNVSGNVSQANQGATQVPQQTNRPITTTGAGTGWGGSEATTSVSNNTDARDNRSGERNETDSNYQLVWILAGFSLFGNVYGWSALLDMRNKYRASLRRSPVSLRDGGL